MVIIVFQLEVSMAKSNHKTVKRSKFPETYHKIMKKFSRLLEN